MERREKYKRIIMFCASAFILAAQTGVFAYIWFSYYADAGVIGKAFWRRGNYVVIGQYALMLFFFYKLYGGFKVGYLRVFDVLYSQILSVICVNGITYLQLALIGHWKFGRHVVPILRMTLFNLVLVVFWVVFMRWIYTKIYPPRRMLMVYGDYSPADLIRKISTREDKYNICETIHLSKGVEAIKAKIDQYPAIVLGDIPAHDRNVFLKYCFERDIRCYSIPKISDVMIQSAENIHLFDTTLLLFRNRGLTAEQRIAKRLFDIAASLLGVIIASPFMIIIAILIKAYDRGPVFYKQERLTENNRIFYVLKFRSMRVDSEVQGARLAMKKDSRVTPIGKVLRNIHFDELPQLFNILKGDMSLVGPRPERPEIAEEYKREIPEFDYRLKVKAGLTGFAQVYGKYNTTPYDKLKLDLTYIENYSFWLDLKLLFLTFKILFQKENTEGVEHWQVTAATKEKEKREKKARKDR
ncbi:MAG: exopolysaccharide biosynthesis polyprenyl glycosylphosphotransferase [Lachnospiraceae bacterium]|jgi:exopolysaccharide biosynthesis polyprenyl glycosylphosphotransferase|nr:exopolysaccharide biosynthesis polyprenyl glycosylphosphotransferase [Lachnospiraceae bacterium]